MKKFSQGLWLTFTFLSMVALGFNDNLRGPLFFDILQDFKLTDLQGAWFYSAASITGFFASLACAPLLKKMNLLQLLILSLLCMAFSLLGIGYFKDFHLFLMAAAGFGVSLGLMGVAQNSAIPFLTTPEGQTRAYSAMHALYGFSSVLAPMVVGWGVLRGWAWREFFTASGVFVLILFLLTLWAPQPLWAREHRTAPQPEKNSLKELGWGAVIISFSLGFYVMTEIMVGSRLSLYTIRELGLTTAQASRYVTGFYLCLLAGRLLGVFFRWPGSIRNHLTVSLATSFLALIAGLYLNPWWFAFSGLTMSIFYPTFMVYLSGLYKARMGVMMSLVMAIQSLAIVMMHEVIGYLSDTEGIRVAFHAGLVFIALSLLALWKGHRVEA